MSIYLNGTAIKGHDLTVNATLTLSGEDLSGNSSSTAQADKGDKPKTLSVRVSIRFKDSGYLSSIMTLAQARDGAGNRIKYNVINDLAKAMSIRQVQFQGTVSCYENHTQRQWDVSFELVEFRSVPEKKMQRQAKAKPVRNQVSSAQPVSGATSQTVTTSSETPEQLTSFERDILKPLNDLLK